MAELPTFDWKTFIETLQEPNVVPEWLNESLRKPFAEIRATVEVDFHHKQYIFGRYPYNHRLFVRATDDYLDSMLFGIEDHKLVFNLRENSGSILGFRMSEATLQDVYTVLRHREKDSKSAKLLALALHDFVHGPIGC